MTQPSAPDWEEFVRRQKASGPAELDLAALKPGDTLLVITRHTAYTFKMLENREALVSTNRPDRPVGRVRINGCTVGASSTIKADHVFCGGNLEFIIRSASQICTTTEIRALQLLQADTKPPV